MHIVLNIISGIATFIVFSGIIYYVLELVFGRINFLNQVILINKIKIKHIVFYIVAIFLLHMFTTFYFPYK